MQTLDYVVLVSYFLVLIAIGVYASRKIHRQVDFFLGGRSFGKLLQTFAAFGAGTGSSDPVNTGRTTFTGGMSGMWSVMYWLFVTPFYWITGVWYRRMRHLTLGDWFVERYESRALGVGYALFGLMFFMLYGSMLFSAIGKVAAPLVQAESVELWTGLTVDIEYVLVPIIGLVVLIYGIAGGLEAAYFTDLVQGLCIILLSVILVPFGLTALVEKFGDPASQGMLDGFRIMHERVPESYFHVVGSSITSEFTLGRILAVVVINLVGIVVQPHFIATGGGSAKTEMNARVGLVVGNFLKRFCTVGWVLTGLIALALFADNPVLLEDPDKTWGVASRELLTPGLRGLMLACLLAALMSSVDAYMVVGSGLVVRNIYAPFFDPHASEQRYLLMGRLTGALVVLGAVLFSLYKMDVFLQLQLTWVFQVLFAAPFWVGMYWRRGTTAAAWITVAYCALVFFLIPFFAPFVSPGLRTSERFLIRNEMVLRKTTRPAAPADLPRENTRIARLQQRWDAESDRIAALADPEDRRRELDTLGPRPTLIEVGQPIVTEQEIGGQAVFWPSVKPVDEAGQQLEAVQPQPAGEPRRIDDTTVDVPLEYPPGTRLMGFGSFKLDFLLYQWLGLDLTRLTGAQLGTLELPPKIIAPFLVMILASLVTRPNSKATLDRYYAKMKTPVDPDPTRDEQRLEAAYADPERLEAKKLFPGTSLEFQRPTGIDLFGFLLCFAVCFAIIGLALIVARIGG